MLYQILVVFIAIVAVLLVYNRYHNRRTSLQTFILWVFLWIFLALFAIVPESSSFLANYLGIGRGLDLIAIFGLIFVYYLVFRIYLKIEKIEHDITELVRKIAFDDKIEFEDDKEDK